MFDPNVWESHGATSVFLLFMIKLSHEAAYPSARFCIWIIICRIIWELGWSYLTPERFFFSFSRFLNTWAMWDLLDPVSGLGIVWDTWGCAARLWSCSSRITSGSPFLLMCCSLKSEPKPKGGFPGSPPVVGPGSWLFPHSPTKLEHMQLSFSAVSSDRKHPLDESSGDARLTTWDLCPAWMLA